MDFDRYRKQGTLGVGRAAREQSSVEILHQAKAERAARQAERQRQRAASTVARWWQGSVTRSAERRRLRCTWLEQYGSLVSKPQEVIPSSQLAASVLPPVLAAYLPGLCRHEQRQALLAGVALPAALLSDTAALRGCFALLLRSLAAPTLQHNMLGLAVAAGEGQAADAHAEEGSKYDEHAGQPSAWAQQQAQLVSQLQRLVLLCCSLIGATTEDAAHPSGSTTAASTDSGSSRGGPSGAALDPLVQAAAGRVVGILCNPSLWKCFGQQHHAWLQQRLYAWLAPLPLLRSAAQRLVAVLAASDAGSSASGTAQQQQGQQPQPQLAAVLNGLVAAQLQLLRQLQQHADGTAPQSVQAASEQVLQLLATPGLLPLLSPSSVALLTASPGFVALLQAAATWQPDSSNDSSPAGSSAPNMLGLLGTLAQLAAGRKSSRSQQGQQGRQVEFLPPSPLLQQEGVPAALAAAVLALMNPALDSSRSSSGGTALALEQLWPFAEGTFAAQLLSLLPLPLFASLYHHLLVLADAASGGRSSGSSSSRSAGRLLAARLLSALAFGTQLLPRMWRQLANGIGLPLEAPMQATRGWEVPTLRRGMAGLQAQAAAQLGLFSRVYCHHLQVVDDFEFHERQEPFSLGQQRAIAAAINTLVFRTQLPDSGPGAAPGAGPRPGAKLGREYMMLQQAAPLLHRALYERDARRTFCPPALWLEPYHHLVGISGSACKPQARGQTVSGAAVVRALLAAADGEAGQAPAPDSPEAGRAAGAAIGDAAPGVPGAGAAAASRPAAVAAILMAAPQCVPFEERVAVFRALIEQDQERIGYHLAPVDGGARPVPVTIRRGYVLEDAVSQLSRLGAKARLSVTFISQQGMQEAGVDMGGLMKELLEGVVAEGFDPNRGLFSATPDGCAYPNPLAERLEGGLAALEALGLVLGRALYECLLLDLPLAPFFVSRLQGRTPLFDDLGGLDPEVHRSLVALKRHDGDAADLGLDFTVESDFLGSTVSEELVPGGSRLGVNNSNLLQYVYLVADWHLNKRLGTAAAAFSRGLSQVIPPAWLRLFSPREVNQLLGGGEGAALDVGDMEAHTQYSGGYGPSSTTIKHFWAVVRGMTQAEQRALLKFATSVSRAPLGGFRHLTPPLTIHKVDCGASLLASLGGKDVDRLPTASTCSNTLKLPNFRRASTLREKLLYAIKSGSGFELS